MENQFRVEAWKPGNAAVVADCADYHHARMIFLALTRVYPRVVTTRLDTGETVDNYTNT